jgi:hypothetical protein
MLFLGHINPGVAEWLLYAQLPPHLLAALVIQAGYSRTIAAYGDPLEQL